MMENLSISSEERTDYQTGRDMLSELPLSIIHIIIGLGSVRDAVKTSLLSRKWRYTWTGVPELDFYLSYPPSLGDESRDKYEERVESFITHVLLLHNGPIHTFRVYGQFDSNCRNIGAWLRYLSRNDIRELSISMFRLEGYDSPQELHSSIYSCKKLIRLELDNCKMDPPPTTFKAFLFLKSLSLLRSKLSNNEVECLIANCPLLEDFHICSCGNSMLRIGAPNLKKLSVHDDYSEISVYAPLLADLHIGITAWDHSARFNYAIFEGGFTNLVKLYVDSYVLKHLSTGIESGRHGLVIPSLKDISIVSVNNEDIKAFSAVIILIAGAPDLQELHFQATSRYRSEVSNGSCDDFGCVPIFKLEKLRAVIMEYDTVAPSVLALTRILLERSPMLENMRFVARYEMDLNLPAEIERYDWASPNMTFEYTDSVYG